MEKLVKMAVPADSIEIEERGKMDLSQINDEFAIASFERRLYPSHVGKIKTAILTGKMLDCIVTGYLDGKNPKIHIIDGQHRLAALYELYKEGKLKSYPIIIRKIQAKNEADARLIYLAINSGKPLTLKDILKAFDDGHNVFFNTLRPFCTHDGTKKKLSFANVASALYYVRQKNKFHKPQVENFIKSVEKSEAIRMSNLIATLYANVGENTDSLIYAANILRALTRFYFENFANLHEGKFARLVRLSVTDKTIKANANANTLENYELVYNYFKDKYAKMGD